MNHLVEIFNCLKPHSLMWIGRNIAFSCNNSVHRPRGWLFCSPRLVYQMFRCRYSKTLLSWFRKAKHFQTELQNSRFIIVAFNCYQLAFGISQANTTQVQLSSDFNRFQVFGLAHKHLIKFGVVEATFWCEFMEERLFQSLLVWGVVTLMFQSFSNMIFDSPTYSWNG